MKKTAVFTFICFIICFTPITANAFSIKPTKYLITADPGTSQKVTIKITNTEKKDLKFKLGVVGVKVDDNKRPTFINGYDIAESWVKTETNELNVVAGKEEYASFIISVPKNATPGAHYLGLSAEQVNYSGASVGVSAKLITLLSLQVSGTIIESLQIEKWFAKKEIYQDNNWKFGLTIKNLGNIELPLKGKMEIINKKEKIVYSKDVYLGNELFVDSNRSIPIEAKINKNDLLPGQYQARISIIYGKTSQRAVANVNIWYLPKWVKPAAVVILILFVSTATLIIRRKKGIKNK